MRPLDIVSGAMEGHMFEDLKYEYKKLKLARYDGYYVIGYYKILNGINKGTYARVRLGHYKTKIEAKDAHPDVRDDLKDE